MKSSSTGVVAELADTGDRLILVDRASGEITMGNIQIEGQNEAVANITSYANFAPIDVTGKRTGTVRKLTDVDQLLGASLNNLRALHLII